MPNLEVAALFPRHLNLNGDLANAGVLAKRAGWYGLNVTLNLIDLGDEPPEDVDLVILGHGSASAWVQILNEGSSLLAWLYDQIDRGARVISISTGYEHLAGLGYFGQELAETSARPAERRSEFAVCEAELFGEVCETLGYLNSQSNLPLVAQHGSIIGSLLHGPFLAKNPKVADLLLADLVGSALTPASQASAAQFQRVSALVEQTWKLERPA